MKRNIPIIFIALGLSVLATGAFIGVLISLVYISPDFLKDVLPFNQLRPMHTTSVVSWIVLTATGGLYYYLSQVEKIKMSNTLSRLHLVIFLLCGVGIYFSFISGKMGGREYLEYLPILTVPVLVGWALFGLNYFTSMLGKVKNWPVYYWMWGIGLIFMVYHLSEAHFWIFSDIRGDFIKDMSIQWKSYGSFVGSWNMLVYGTAIYLMAKIKGDESTARGKKVFFFFFLGLTNLMFGWAHHTYIIPQAPWIRYVAYGVSMTEWIILVNIIYTWAKSLKKETKKQNILAYRFLIMSEIWVFLNLFLALLMSIPTINFFTHGTHITVAHSMGTTIGINTTILLASVVFIVKRLVNNEDLNENRTVMLGFKLFNGSFLLFWLALVIGGIYKAVWMTDASNTSFGALHESLTPIFIVFIFFGCILFIGLLMIILPLLQKLFPHCYYEVEDR
jgi:nitric oxide reductase subunit B